MYVKVADERGLLGTEVNVMRWMCGSALKETERKTLQSSENCWYWNQSAW